MNTRLLGALAEEDWNITGALRDGYNLDPLGLYAIENQVGTAGQKRIGKEVRSSRRWPMPGACASDWKASKSLSIQRAC